MAKRRRQNSAGLSLYDSLDTKTLQELLREDAKRDTIRDGELEVLLYIMGILAQREQRLRKSTEQAWKEFQQRRLHHIRLPSVILSPWLRRDAPAAWGVFPPS